LGLWRLDSGHAAIIAAIAIPVQSCSHPVLARFGNEEALIAG
jgi:hypothetical protein